MGRMRGAVAWKRRLAAALGRPGRLAVLGVGNLARGDDAAGVRAAEALARLADAGTCGRLKVFVTEEAPENFTGRVRACGADVVLVLDAAAGGFPPGTIHLVDLRQIAREDVSTHRTPLSTLAEFLDRTAGCRVVILGIEPQSFAAGALLSPAVRDAVQKVVRYLAAFVSRRLRSSSASGHKYS
jgi:hydrogenase maturation protease